MVDDVAQDKRHLPLRGSCACGDVRFRIEGETGAVVASHSAACRKSSGHFSVSVAVKQDSLVVERGMESIAWYAPKDEERGFCVICGATLFRRAMDETSALVWVSLGALDGETGLSIDRHLHAEDKGDYYEIA